MWIDGLIRKNQEAARSALVNPVDTNYTVLAKHLLSPHGQSNGLERPDHRAQGEDLACECPRVSAAVSVPKVQNKTPLVKSQLTRRAV